MKVIDLTHTISENMPIYPGTDIPKLEVANTYEKNRFVKVGETEPRDDGFFLFPYEKVI